MIDLKKNISSLTAKLTIPGATFYGFSDVMPNPDPILKGLGWNKDVETYQELLNDPQLYGAIENNRKPGVKALEMYLDNPNCPPEEVEFFRKYFSKLASDGIYDNITSASLDAVLFGRITFGLMWDTVDGYFVPVKITPIPHKYCKFNINDELLVATENATFAPPEHPARYVTLQHKPTLDNPYGEPLLAKCYWNVIFKKESRKLWAMFTEKFGIPWVAGNYNPQLLANAYGTTIDNAAQLFFDALSSMARDGVIIFPDGTNVNLVDASKGSSSDIFEKMVRICDEQNTKLVLGHSGATESTSGDKLSNDTTATDVRKSIIDADKAFPITFWNKLIEWIHFFNFNGDQKPRFDLYAKEDVDMQWAERDNKLVNVLALSGKKLSKSYFIKTYGFDEDDLIETEPEPITDNTPTPNALATTHIVAQKDEFADQTLIDEFADKLVQSSQPTEKILLEIIEKINSLDGYQDAEAKIATLLDTIDTANFEEKLADNLFLADLIGRLSVNEEHGVGDERRTDK